MFKDKVKQREYQAAQMRKRRAVIPVIPQAQGITAALTENEGITPPDLVTYAPAGITDHATELGITGTKGTENTGFSFYKRKYPALVYAVADQDKRKRLTRVCEELKSRHLLTEVTYGMGGPRFDVVQDVLECLT